MSILGKTLNTQQEKSDLLESLKSLIDRFSTDKLEEVLPPANANIQKGRPSTTKRDKTGEEHEDEKIKEEINKEKKRKRREEAEIKKEGKRSKKNSATISTATTKKEADLLSERYEKR